MDLRGRVALVTGGATGIGRATVLELARSGAAGVAINYRTARKEAEELAGEVRRIGAEALCLHADVRSEEQVRGMVRQVEERLGRLDALVNNAGVTRWIPLADLQALTDSVWDEILDVNLSLAYGAAKAALIYLTRGLAVALAPTVRVNAVAPAFTDTSWMREHYGEDYDRVVTEAAAGIPLRRIATPGDIAAAIVSLITGSDFVTGQTLLVDGGLSLV